MSLTIKRKGALLFYLIPAVLIVYPLFYQAFSQTVPFKNTTTLLLYILFSVLLTVTSHSRLRYFVQVSETELNFNKVANIPFDSIQHAYFGTMSDFVSIEERDSLPLAMFKQPNLSYLFKVKESKRDSYPSGMFLALHVNHSFYLVQASHFKRTDMDNLLTFLNDHAVKVEHF